MSKYIDDDDLYDDQADYDDEDFVEEDLPQDEYDQLHELLPTIRAQFANYNNAAITDEVLKKTLWLNYFVLEDSVEEIKSNYKKIPHIQTFTPRLLLIGGSSKLAQLAQKRAAARKLREEEQQQANGNLEQQTHKAVSILDKLSGTKSVPQDVKNSVMTEMESVPVVSEEEPVPVPVQIPEVEVPSADIEVKGNPLIKDIQLDSSLLTPHHTQFTQIITFTTKKRKLNHTEILKPIYTNDLIIVNKITTNFNKPSPDDIILRAQANAFNDIEKNMEKISLAKPVKKLKKNVKIDLSRELAKIKPQLSFVIFGHVDSGKSTIIGRMLYDLKIVDSKTLHKLQQESDKIGKGSFALAWIMDQTDEERSRGVTVDIVNTSIETDSVKLNIIDSPGHQDFVPQLINGIAQADVGVLIIDCNDFTSGFTHVREQVLISKNLGVDELIIALNKLDLFDYNTKNLTHIIDDLTANLTEVGYTTDKLHFVPVSGLLGDNIVKKSANFEWPLTLIDHMQNLVFQRQQITTADTTTTTTSTTEPFVLTTTEILDTSNTKELRVNGRINSGYAVDGDEFQTLPTASVLKLDLPANQSLIVKGDFISNLKFKILSASAAALAQDSLANGDVITNDIANFETGNKLAVDLQLFELNKPLLIGTAFVLFHNCKQYPAKISKIISVYKDGEPAAYKKRHLVSLARAKVVIELAELLPFNLQIDKLTRVVVRKDSAIIGCGKIESSSD